MASLLRRLPSWALPLLLGVLLVAAPWLGTSAHVTRQLQIIAVYALVVSALNLTFGLAGEFSLAQVAVFGIGAYVGGIAATAGLDLAVILLLSGVVGVAIGLVTGIPGFRLQGWGLAMISFFLLVLLPDVVQLLEQWTGGRAGLTGIPRAPLFGIELSGPGYYVVITLIAVCWFAVLRNLVTSTHGDSLRILRSSRVLAAGLGISVTRLKLTAYVLAAVPAGVAGALYAGIDRFLVPEFFGLDLAIAIIAASVLGGRDSVYGPFLGAAVILLGPQQVTVFQDFTYLAYGVFLVVGGVFFTGGLAGIGRTVVARWAPVAVADTAPRTEPAVAEEPREGADLRARPVGRILELRSVAKRFGGAVAVDGVTLQVLPGTVTGLVGANGSGKTTLINLVSGYHRPTAGEILLGGERIDGLRPDRLARLGVARTFQTPVVPHGLTVLDLVAAAVPWSGRGTGVAAAILRSPGYRRSHRARRAEALRVLGLLGIVGLATRQAAEVPLGSRRLVEVARVMAASPSLVLLDEPASGLDEREVDELADVVIRLAGRGATVVVVEHNVEFVSRVADQLVALDMGKVLAAGPPDVVRTDPEVVDRYLGSTAVQPPSMGATP